LTPTATWIRSGAAGLVGRVTGKPEAILLGCGMHKERGPETIETVVKMFAGHDLNHFQQIERILPSRTK
jgi:hypothetical protein